MIDRLAKVFALLLGLFTIGTFMSNNVRTILADARSPATLASPTKPGSASQTP